MTGLGQSFVISCLVRVLRHQCIHLKLFKIPATNNLLLISCYGNLVVDPLVTYVCSLWFYTKRCPSYSHVEQNCSASPSLVGGPHCWDTWVFASCYGNPEFTGDSFTKDWWCGDVMFPLMRVWKSCWQRVDLLVIWNVYWLRALYGPQMKNIGWLFISRQQQMPCCKWKSYIYGLGYTSMFGDAATKFGLDQITCLQSNS